MFLCLSPSGRALHLLQVASRWDGAGVGGLQLHQKWSEAQNAQPGAIWAWCNYSCFYPLLKYRVWVINLLDTNYRIFFQVLNKKIKSKQSVGREEPHNRTRDIYSIHELYPSQWCSHSSSATSFSLYVRRGRLVIALTALTSIIKNQSWRRGRESIGFLLYTCKSNFFSFQHYEVGITWKK